MMKQNDFLPKALVVPSNIAHSKGDMQTVEERRLMEFENFKTDAGATIVGAMGSMVKDIALNTAYIFRSCGKSEVRQKYNLLHDYTRERDVEGACMRIESEVRKYERTLGDFVRGLSYVSRLSASIDAGDSFMDRCDVCDAEFSGDYEAIRKAIYDKFKPYKCTDPMALYRLMYAIFMSRRFNAVAEYIEMYSQGFGKGEPLHLMTRLRVTEPLQNLASRCNFRNKDGQPLVFHWTKDYLDEYEKLKQKKSWQNKNAGVTPVEINIWRLFSDDDIVRPVWVFERHLMELKTIDKMIQLSSGHDPEYRMDYTMRRIQSCAETFEQSMLNSTICVHRWYDLPRRMKEYLESREKVKCINPKRRPKPVVCFDIRKRKDGEIYFQFHGIWNSTNEAEREMCIKASAIRKSIERSDNDGCNHIWYSIEEYCRLVLKTLRDMHPEIAEEFERLVNPA